MKMFVGKHCFLNSISYCHILVSLQEHGPCLEGVINPRRLQNNGPVLGAHNGIRCFLEKPDRYSLVGQSHCGKCQGMFELV